MGRVVLLQSLERSIPRPAAPDHDHLRLRPFPDRALILNSLSPSCPSPSSSLARSLAQPWLRAPCARGCHFWCCCWGCSSLPLLPRPLLLPIPLAPGLTWPRRSSISSSKCRCSPLSLPAPFHVPVACYRLW